MIQLTHHCQLDGNSHLTTVPHRDKQHGTSLSDNPLEALRGKIQVTEQ
jgi:hypothetical protein